MPKKKLKPIPEFKTEDEERNFWATHDTTDYIDWSKAEFTHFPNLKPSTENISLRLPQGMLDDIRMIAKKIDVPYQSFIKMVLAEKIQAVKGR